MGIKRIAAALAALLLIPAAGLADLKLREDTPAMGMLKSYTENVNRLLTENGEQPINSVFANFPAETVMGITFEDNAEIPESVEITVEMTYDNISMLELRVSELDRFPVIAAALIKALYNDAMTQEEALRVPAERVKKAQKDPQNSFEEKVEELQGTVPRTYYAYKPNQYRDGVDWIQMTLIFPVYGAWDGESGLILGTEDESGQPAPDDADPDYEGYFSGDDYTHYEIFTTATPEPDSAAAEYDFRKPVGGN